MNTPAIHFRIRNPLFIALVAAAATVCASGMAQDDASAEDVSLRDLEKQHRRLQLELVTRRQALLRDDPEIAEIHRRILKLYEQMEAKMAGKGEIPSLLERMRALEERIQTLKNRQPPSGEQEP